MARLLMRLTLLLALATTITPLPGATVLASQTGSDQLDLPQSMVPPDYGQTSLEVYVPETGHTVAGVMLDYWRANGASSVYGNPISEVFVASNGFYSQAFERGIFQYNPDWTMTDNPIVRLMPATVMDLRADAADARSDGRRTRGERRLSAWTPGVEQQARLDEVTIGGGRFDDVTGFSIAGEFGEWYDAHEGWFYLGAPLSEPHRSRGTTIQYFENSALVAYEAGVAPAAIPLDHPELAVAETDPVTQGFVPEFSEELFLDQPNPYGVDASSIPGRKRIEVSLADQTLTAYQGDRIVLQTPVSTGVTPNDTEVGQFRVRIKYVEKDMAGVTDGRGAVTAVGEDAEGGQQYFVENVPHVMFINYEAEALHGAYWHDNFGQRMSHGCINLPLDVAAFLYEWAPLGTAVTVSD